MTTTVSSAKPASTPTTKAHEAKTAGQPGAFSAVLQLKLGMGLSTSMPAAQNPRVDAQSPTATPADPASSRDAGQARAEAPQPSPAGPSRPEAPIDPRDEAPDRAEAKTDRSADDRGDTPAMAPCDATPVGEPQTPKAQVATPEPQTPTTDSPVAAQAADPAMTDPSAAAAAVAATAASAATTAGAAETVKTAAVGALTRRGGPARPGARGEGQAREADADAGTTADPTAAQGAAEAPAEKTPGATQARDPLGLIRMPAGNPDRPDEARAEAGQAQSGPERARFADSAEMQGASRGQSSNAQTGATGTMTNNAAAAMSGAVAGAAMGATGGTKASGGTGAVGGVGSVGAAGATGGGTGGGTGGASGGVGDLAGLMGGRLGVGVFGLTRGRGVASAGGAPVSREAVQAQIAQGLAAVLNQKGGVMTLRLNPEHLGSMKIDLAIEGGKVTATFDAQNEQTRQILRDGLDGLKRSIEQAGLTVHKVEVVNAPAGGAAADPQHGREQGRSAADGGQSGSWGGSSREQGRGPGPEAEAEVEAAGSGGGGVWVEEDGAARGLLRLRVDTLI